MRGEDQSRATPPPGSPPHAWVDVALVGVRGRFTPTCVGKTHPTCVDTSRRTLPSVHPHMRGEDLAPVFNQLINKRFTPTCVGKMSSSRSCSICAPPTEDRFPAAAAFTGAVHPHMRGEDNGGYCRLRAHRRFAWGRQISGQNLGRSGYRGEDLRRVWAVHARLRFTPTCVGKTAYADVDRFTKTVGKTSRIDRRGLRFTPTCVGKTGRLASSENLIRFHAWGRPNRSSGSGLPPRFTPTCVGKTELRPRVHCRAVHPHMRGEDLIVFRFQSTGYDGSPPHAWGRLHDSLTRTSPARLCVGRSHPLANQTVAVHPHMRGEDDGIRLNRFTPTMR